MKEDCFFEKKKVFLKPSLQKWEGVKHAGASQLSCFYYYQQKDDRNDFKLYVLRIHYRKQWQGYTRFDNRVVNVKTNRQQWIHLIQILKKRRPKESKEKPMNNSVQWTMIERVTFSKIEKKTYRPREQLITKSQESLEFKLHVPLKFCSISNLAKLESGRKDFRIYRFRIKELSFSKKLTKSINFQIKPQVIVKIRQLLGNLWSIRDQKINQSKLRAEIFREGALKKRRTEDKYFHRIFKNTFWDKTYLNDWKNKRRSSWK